MFRHRILAMTLALVVASGLVVSAPTQQADAANASDFRPGNLISDANFFNGKAMSGTAVQHFINTKNAGCKAGYTCLDTYAQATPTIAADEFCGPYRGGNRESAASIIARVGAACNISQKALLVLLEKEQSLISHRSPTASRYAKATGFGCPDTAACDSSVAGFFYQIYYGARQFQRYAKYPESYNHRAGVTNRILFNPNNSCGSSQVRIENQATAGLYNYTPYQPNAAAMRNLYGAGDSCSAYGNRNFWRMYTDWFGDPRDGNSPAVGKVASQSSSNGLQVGVKGWAFDPDTTEPVRVHAYAGEPYPKGKFAGAFTADWAWSGIDRPTPGGGNRFGFSQSVTVPTGTSKVCLHAIDRTGQGNTMIGCTNVTPKAGTPLGNFEGSPVSGSTASLRGWAHDPDTKKPIRVHIYRGGPYGKGTMYKAIDANRPRADVDRSIATAGPAHGVDQKVPVGANGDVYCMHAINVSGGENRLIGCRSFKRGSATKGNVDSATYSSGNVTLTGWALNPDSPEPVSVRVTVNGEEAATLEAAEPRSDVQRTYATSGPEYGFSVQVPVPDDAPSEVCVEAVDAEGVATPLGCRTVTPPGD